MFAFETIKNVLKQNIQINYLKYVPMYDNHERIKNREWCTLNELQISCTHLSKKKNNITDVIDDVLSSHIQILLIDNSQYVKPCDLC